MGDPLTQKKPLSLVHLFKYTKIQKIIQMKKNKCQIEKMHFILKHT